jgi:hypothetical protein
MTFDELYELYVTATNEIATLKDENKALLKQLQEKTNEYGHETRKYARDERVCERVYKEQTPEV